MKQKSIKTVRPISEEEIKRAPWVSVKSAITLTGLGEKVIRTLPTTRFGKSDFASVKALNEFILQKIA
ncbi:MAG: hypothetical protein ABI233_05995 [Chthoniobacterales bacterium]